MGAHGNVDGVDLHQKYIAEEAANMAHIDSFQRTAVTESLGSNGRTAGLYGAQLPQKITSVNSRMVTSRL